jgi:hypothetical protein
MLFRSGRRLGTAPKSAGLQLAEALGCATIARLSGHKSVSNRSFANWTGM